MTFFAVNAPGVETNITNMPESGLIVLSVCSVLLACVLLIPTMLAGRAPRRTEAVPSWTGAVEGGIHPGEGRSVAPHRDAPAEGPDREKVVQVQGAGDEGGAPSHEG